MAVNRIRFQPGMSLFEFFQARGAMLKARKTFQCNRCRHQSSLIAGTPIRGYQAGADRVVSGHVPHQPGHEQSLGPGPEARPGG
jgi:hypothetical protein